MTATPYCQVSPAKWLRVTEGLIDDHPLKPDQIVTAVFDAWEGLFTTSIGKHGLRIGEHIFPKPQVIGALLHELIPAEFVMLDPASWRAEETKGDKDIVYIPDDKYSIELKTSSHPSQIFGNRSYAQPPSGGTKGKDGYYLTVNFEKFSASNPKPDILFIRFGWIGHSDWIGQVAQTGQQARLKPETYLTKFRTLYAKHQL